MKVEVEFYSKPIEEITLEEIVDALDLAKQTTNRCSVALREQGYPVGGYVDGGIADLLTSAFAKIQHAEDQVTLLIATRDAKPQDS